MVRFQTLDRDVAQYGRNEQWNEARQTGREPRSEYAAVERRARAAPPQEQPRRDEPNRAGCGDFKQQCVVVAAGRVIAAVGRRVGDQGGEQPEGQGTRNLPKGHGGLFLGPAEGEPGNRVVQRLPPGLGPGRTVEYERRIRQL